MNYDELLRIIGEVKKINSMQAKKLSKLVQKHMDETDEEKKVNLERRIKDALYWTFIGLLDSDSKCKIYNYGIDIIEECTMVESDAKNGWYVCSKGAFRYVPGEDNKAILTNKIPREYKRGFYLVNGSGMEAIEFINKYDIALKIISKKMDEREEVITFKKKPKNKNIPCELLEDFIDFLNLPRINIEEDESLIKKEFIKE